MLPPLLLVVGSSYAIHVMARYYEQVGRARLREWSWSRAFERVWLPLVISAFTTVIGFGSLMVNRITAIWDSALFAVVGIVCVTITSLTFLPPRSQLMPVERAARRSGDVSPMLSDALRRLGTAGLRRSPRPILVDRRGHRVLAHRRRAAASRSTRTSSTTSSRTPQVRLANETINQPIVGTNPFYVVIEGDEARRAEALGGAEAW